MLKKMYRLFLGLVVVTSSACVTPTHASSAFDVVLVHIQASGPTGAKEEMVSIYNNTSVAITISDWCLKNKANVAFACFETDSSDSVYSLPSHTFAMVATESFLSTKLLNAETATVIFAVTNQSSGSIVNSADTITLVDSTGQIVDSKSWASAIPTGKVLARAQSLLNPLVYETADPLLNWSFTSLAQVPINQAEVHQLLPADDPEDEPEIQPGDDIDSPVPVADPVVISEILHPSITELLPDAEGADTGNEFIELYNPTTTAISLGDYKLRVGPNLEKVVNFPIGAAIPAYTYAAYTNGEMSYSLLNSSSAVQLEYKGQLIGNAVVYSGSVTGKSWASIESVWRYSSTPTPGTANQISLSIEETESEDDSAESTIKPCAVNQYRSPETNRCRLITTASASTVAPCKVGQERNLETNRCRNIATTTTPTPCKEGQERNQETNRCRNITKMVTTDYGVKGATTKAGGTAWYLWLAVVGVGALIIGYAVWEWREELKNVINGLRAKFARNKP